MTCKEIEELIDAYDNKLAEWAEKYSSLQMDLDQEKYEKSVLVRQMARAYVRLDKIDAPIGMIQIVMDNLWAGLFEVCGDKTVDEVIKKLGGGTDG